MARVTRFNSKRRSAAQKAAAARGRAVVLAARRASRRQQAKSAANPKQHAIGTRSAVKVPARSRKVPKVDSVLRERIASFERQLHNLRRKNRRAQARIECLQAENVSLKTENKSLKAEIRDLSRALSEARQASSSGDTSLTDLPKAPSPSNKLSDSHKRLQKKADALRKQVERAKARRKKGMDKVLTKGKERVAVAFYIKHKGQITGDARRMIRGLIERGVPFKHVISVIEWVLGFAGVRVEGSCGERSICRAILEGLVWAQLQIGDEISRTKSITISGDGTTLKNVHLESAFLTYKVPGAVTEDGGESPDVPQLRALPVMVAPNHTSEEQLHGWKSRFAEIITTWNDSPFCPDRRLVLSEVLGKTKGMLSDHANDQKRLAELFEQWKEEVDREARGLEAVMSMTASELMDFSIHSMQQCLADLGGGDYRTWDALSDFEKQRKLKEAWDRAVRNLGQQRFEQLPPDEQRWASLFLWAGCGMHKEMNSVKWGARAMEKFWTTPQAQEIGAIRPIPLHNKDNDAAINDKTASSSRARAEQMSARGGVKTTALAGAIFRNKYDKKGQQDNYRWFFASLLGFIVRFPDTSNTRFGSHCEAAAELLVHYLIYIQFLDLVRNSKDKAGFNHMEQNLWNALHDPSTLTELAVLALYSQAISHPYMRYIRGSPSLNGMDLGPFHQQVISHCEKLANNPDLFLSLDADSHRETTLDGSMWERPEAVYAIRRLYQDGKLPFLSEVLRAFFSGAIEGWQRFSSEYEEGGRIDRATSPERAAAFVRASNCHNESRLGRRVTAHRYAPAMSHDVWNAETMHRSNNTDAWVAQNATPELSRYVARKARERDSSGTLARARRRHVQEQEQKAARNMERRAKRVAQAKKVEAITPHLDADYWASKPLRQINAKEVQQTLTWLRAAPRKHIVQVPTGLSKAGVGKEGRVNALIAILRGLNSDQLSQLQGSNASSTQETASDTAEDDDHAERDDAMDTDEDL